jgi:putative phosphoesterase
MRLAAISDVHGNLDALEAVLEDIARRGVEQIVNLGDLLSGPLYPVETADRLQALGLPTIQGNHERQVLTFERAQLNASDLHAASTLRADQLAWLAGLPASLQLLGEELLLVHGTLQSDLTHFLETITEEGLRSASEAELVARAGPAQSAVILCGHSHLSGVRRLADGRLVVNPGSVGLQAYEAEHPFPHRVQTGSPHARYACLEKREGRWTAELVAVAYDWEHAAGRAERNGRPEWARALRTGSV